MLFPRPVRIAIENRLNTGNGPARLPARLPKVNTLQELDGGNHEPSHNIAPATEKKPLATIIACGTVCTMTRAAGSGARVKSPLTELENEVMQTVWKSGPCAVEAVHEVVSQKRKLKETSVRTILRRLEQKGYLKHEEKGRAYIYRAVEPARNICWKSKARLMSFATFCHTSRRRRSTA